VLSDNGKFLVHISDVSCYNVLSIHLFICHTSHKNSILPQCAASVRSAAQEKFCSKIPVCQAVPLSVPQCELHLHTKLHIQFLQTLTLSNPIFLPHAHPPTLIYFGWERGCWITCNYPTVLKHMACRETERVQPALSVG
jgi:hypothetical protein